MHCRSCCSCGGRIECTVLLHRDGRWTPRRLCCCSAKRCWCCTPASLQLRLPPHQSLPPPGIDTLLPPFPPRRCCLSCRCSQPPSLPSPRSAALRLLSRLHIHPPCRLAARLPCWCSQTCYRCCTCVARRPHHPTQPLRPGCRLRDWQLPRHCTTCCWQATFTPRRRACCLL